MFAIGYVNNFEAATPGVLHRHWQDKLLIKAASGFQLSLFVNQNLKRKRVPFCAGYLGIGSRSQLPKSLLSIGAK
jgi:hypothetical protein